ncbi:MAG: ATP-binding protein [Chloroflexi bacterium]|nr:ATP-binding protein [Chloroflexota bacterium]
MAFYNRQHELEDIAHVLGSSRAELAIVYGRRGVGKSALLVEALAGRPHLYYQATTRALPQQLEDLTAAFRAFAPEAVLPGVFPSFETALNALGQLARSHPGTPIVLVIDELPYLAQADPAVATIFQRWWDGMRRERPSNLKVFLLGSLVSWMEEQTLSGRGPLHNRRTGQIKLEPLPYAEAALFYPRYTSQERIAAYAIWGGMPSYAEEVDPERGLWDNVRDAVLRPGARLADEPQWLRFADLRNDALYSSILRAIALGNCRPSTIAEAVGRQRGDEVAFYLERLCDLRLVQRVVPVHQARQLRSHQSLYLLADHYVAFWYRFVDRLRHLLAMRRFDEALERIQDDFDQYVSQYALEDVCRQFLWRACALDRLSPALSLDALGSWWVARKGEQDQIDVVAMRDGHAVLVGECKWSRQPMDRRDLAELDAALRKAAPDLDPIDRPWRALFSRSGFTDDLRALAGNQEERLWLFTADDLYW